MDFRLATVSFLNAAPLVEAFASSSRWRTMISDLPSRLLAYLQAGRVDAALLPVVEAFRCEGAAFVGSTGIACRGEVASVKLFYEGDLSELSAVLVDRGSRTSVALLQIILGETTGRRPALFEREPGLGTTVEPGRGLLVIGDRCLEFDDRRRLDGAGRIRDLDLGRAWLDLTGRPFVFAAWTMNAGVDVDARSTRTAELSRRLAAARDYGLANLPAIVAREAAAGRRGRGGAATEEALNYYFRHCLRYRLTAEELAGMSEFHRFCVAYGLVPPGSVPQML